MYGTILSLNGMLLVFLFFFFKCHASGMPSLHSQLVIQGRKVTWFQGLDPTTCNTKKVISVDTQILQAFSCYFSKEGIAEGCGSICVREQSCLGVYMENGAVYIVPFPFPVSLPCFLA